MGNNNLSKQERIATLEASFVLSPADEGEVAATIDNLIEELREVKHEYSRSLSSTSQAYQNDLYNTMVAIRQEIRLLRKLL